MTRWLRRLGCLLGRHRWTTTEWARYCHVCDRLEELS